MHVSLTSSNVFEFVHHDTSLTFDPLQSEPVSIFYLISYQYIHVQMSGKPRLSLIKSFSFCLREKKELKRQMDRRRTEKINQAKTKEKHLAEEYDP